MFYSKLLALTAVWVVGCGQTPDPGAALEAGHESYLRYCATCHGGSGEGRPPAFPPLTDPAWSRLPGDALAMIVLYGLQGQIEVAGNTYRGFMPPMQHMSDAEVAAAVGFVQTRWGVGEATVDTAAVTRLREALDRRPPWRSRDEIIEAMETAKP